MLPKNYNKVTKRNQIEPKKSKKKCYKNDNTINLQKVDFFTNFANKY